MVTLQRYNICVKIADQMKKNVENWRYRYHFASVSMAIFPCGV